MINLHGKRRSMVSSSNLSTIIFALQLINDLIVRASLALKIFTPFRINRRINLQRWRLKRKIFYILINEEPFEFLWKTNICFGNLFDNNDR